jgi:hypothetical protein
MAAFLSFLRAFALSLLIFPIGLATHEVMHLAVYSALGYPAYLVVTQWPLGLAGVHIFGLHAAPATGMALLPLRTFVLNNALGPSLAALLLLVLGLAVRGAARTALLANVLALLFFAVIEAAYPLLEHFAGVKADVLLLPELNYGVTLLILLFGSLAGATGQGRPSGDSSTRRAPAAGRLPAP